MRDRRAIGDAFRMVENAIKVLQTSSEADFKFINQIYESLRVVLVERATGRLPTALRFYQQAFRADIDWSVRFLGMMMAMEALFSYGTTEIAHQVSERTAFFLKQSPNGRAE